MKRGAHEGRALIFPVLVVQSVENEAAFLQTVFEAQIGMVSHSEGGEVEHAEARIGESVILLQRASTSLGATSSVVRVATKNVQAALELALKNGGETVPLPTSNSPQQAEAAVSDPHGNIWWIVPQDGKPSNEEVQRRLAEQRRHRL